MPSADFPDCRDLGTGSNLGGSELGGNTVNMHYGA